MTYVVFWEEVRERYIVQNALMKKVVQGCQIAAKGALNP